MLSRAATCAAAAASSSSAVRSRCSSGLSRRAASSSVRLLPPVSVVAAGDAAEDSGRAGRLGGEGPATGDDVWVHGHSKLVPPELPVQRGGLLERVALVRVGAGSWRGGCSAGSSDTPRVTRTGWRPARRSAHPAGGTSILTRTTTTCGSTARSPTSITAASTVGASAQPARPTRLRARAPERRRRASGTPRVRRSPRGARRPTRSTPRARG